MPRKNPMDQQFKELREELKKQEIRRLLESLKLNWDTIQSTKNSDEYKKAEENKKNKKYDHTRLVGILGRKIEEQKKALRDLERERNAKFKEFLQIIQEKFPDQKFTTKSIPKLMRKLPEIQAPFNQLREYLLESQKEKKEIEEKIKAMSLEVEQAQQSKEASEQQFEQMNIDAKRLSVFQNMLFKKIIEIRQKEQGTEILLRLLPAYESALYYVLCDFGINQQSLSELHKKCIESEWPKDDNKKHPELGISIRELREMAYITSLEILKEVKENPEILQPKKEPLDLEDDAEENQDSYIVSPEKPRSCERI